MTGPPSAVPQVLRLESAATPPAGERGGATVLRVVTLNLAHGRLDGVSHLLMSGRRIRSNLQKVAAALSHQQAHVIALQEADGPSAWSGGFDHVAFVARAAGFSHAIRGAHVSGPLTAYGTALLAVSKIQAPVSITFAPSPPTFSKGFVCGRVNWPSGGGDVAIASVHLDFSRQAVRKTQVQELIRYLAGQMPPIVVMGDFNSEWHDDGSAVRHLAEGLNLTAYRPDTDELATYPNYGKRLDWILISKDLVFLDYRVLPEPLSDHLAVVAHLGRRSTP
jgi:endonuclease/exonuclease/phosphatase family metal-dependent hydrolase